MIQLIYTSIATNPFNDDQLRSLLAAARENNQKCSVTGALMHQQGSFLQVLEGPAEAVEPLFQRIGRDRRHQRVMILVRNDIVQPNFPDWSMGFVDVKGNASLLPGFRRIGDLTGLLGDTKGIERVITLFRDGRWQRAA